MDHLFKLGNKLTSNLFFVEDVLYIEMLKSKDLVTNHPGNVVCHKVTQSSVYLAWNYKTGHKRHVDYDTFKTQLNLFKYFKEHHEDYIDTLTEDLLNYDLCDIAINSEHLY